MEIASPLGSHLAVTWVASVSLCVCQSCGVCDILHLHWLLESFCSFLLPSLQSSMSSEKRDFMKSSHLALSVPRFLSLCALSSCGSLCSHLMQEEAPLMMAYKALINECSEMSVVILLLCSFSRAVVLVFPLRPWPVSSQAFATRAVLGMGGP